MSLLDWLTRLHFYVEQSPACAVPAAQSLLAFHASVKMVHICGIAVIGLISTVDKVSGNP